MPLAKINIEISRRPSHKLEATARSAGWKRLSQRFGAMSAVA
jgi:hypothetical protein